MNYQEFQNKLFAEAEEGYRDFVLKGTITERPFLGVRVPKCRAFAKEILTGNFDGGVDKFLENKPISFEEVLVRGLVIGGLPYEVMVTKMYDFIELIDDWGICDTFCTGMRKNVTKNREKFLDEIDKMLKSLGEFQTRVALVCLLNYYIEPGYLAVVFDRVNELAPYLSDGRGEMSVERIKGETGGQKTHDVMAWDAYYVKMAVAWLTATSFAHFPEETEAWFKQLNLPKWTHNKAIVKTCESLRVDKDLKERLRAIKK